MPTTLMEASSNKQHMFLQWKIQNQFSLFHAK